MPLMVLLESSQRHSSDLDCAAGQEKFKAFILISDENFVAISPLYCVTPYTFSFAVSALERPSVRNSKGYFSQEQ